MDILNRPTGWFWSIGFVVRFVTKLGSKPFRLLIVEGPALIFRWTPVVGLVKILDWISVQVELIVVD